MRVTAQRACHPARARRVTAIVVAAALIAGGAMPASAAAADDGEPGAPCPAAAAVPGHIRAVDCGVMRAIALGMSGSPTFRAVVERVAALHGIVFVAGQPVVRGTTRRVTDGALLHRVTVGGRYRLLYATVTPYSGARPAPIIAHELHHAIEVLESNAASEREVDALFDRIGVRTSVGKVETAAALDVERAVARELASATRTTGVR